MRVFIRQAAEVVRRIIGVPDYERYIAHCRDAHPGMIPMSRDDFARDALTRRYERPGARCC